LKKKQARYCPGGVCEIKEKEPIQRFTFVQSLIVIVVSIAVVLGLLVLWMSTPSKSAAMQMMPAMLKNLGL
jgi:TRAP-type mannitol/chloroaromatic compound transport system permease large subunit